MTTVINSIENKMIIKLLLNRPPEQGGCLVEFETTKFSRIPVIGDEIDSSWFSDKPNEFYVVERVIFYPAFILIGCR